MKRGTSLLLAGVLVAVVSVTIIVAGGSEEAAATLPAPLERSLTEPGGASEAYDMDTANARRFTLEDGSEAWLVPGENGEACIGLPDGSASCAPAEAVAEGRLMLLSVPPPPPEVQREIAKASKGKTREEQDRILAERASPVPASGSVTVTVLGYHPGATGAGEATAVDADGKVLGRAAVSDGVYEIEAQDVAAERRLEEIRFDKGGKDGAGTAVKLSE